MPPPTKPPPHRHLKPNGCNPSPVSSGQRPERLEHTNYAHEFCPKLLIFFGSRPANPQRPEAQRVVRAQSPCKKLWVMHLLSVLRAVFCSTEPTIPSHAECVQPYETFEGVRPRRKKEAALT